MGLRGFLIRLLGIDRSMHAIYVRQKCLETQLDFLLKMTCRKTRRRWRRMLTHKQSPFYIGDLYQKTYNNGGPYDTLR